MTTLLPCVPLRVVFLERAISSIFSGEAMLGLGMLEGVAGEKGIQTHGVRGDEPSSQRCSWSVWITMSRVIATLG